MPGHVFVVQGRFQALVKDAVVVTTDASFTLEEHWRPVLGGADPARLRPEGWAEGGRSFGHAPGRRDLWFLDVAHEADDSCERLMEALGGALEAIAASGLEASAGRALPLVAVPVPGIGGGGFRERAGAVIAALLQTLDDVVTHHDLDVVVVATTPAQLAAMQQERRRRPSWRLAPELLATAEAIGAAAASGHLALFLGAGVSVPAGLPSWAGLVEEMRSLAVQRGADIPAERFRTLDVLDQTELLRHVLGDDLERLLVQRFQPDTPALSHALLANLGCHEVVTTNYDRCYEAAVVAQDEDATIAVMPWEKPVPGRPWLLKLHGDVGRPQSVVLTRGQFFGYDSRWRPVGSVFQSLLMTREVLVVGASLSDDNVLRLAHEVRELRRRHRIDDPLGRVLGLGAPPLRAQLWSGELEWVSLEGETPEAQARRLEIFLDAVAAHATRTSPYLLRPFYADLLDPGVESVLARRARELAAQIESAAAGGALRQQAGWLELLEHLRWYGAPGE